MIHESQLQLPNRPPRVLLPAAGIVQHPPALAPRASIPGGCGVHGCEEAPEELLRAGTRRCGAGAGREEWPKTNTVLRWISA